MLDVNFKEVKDYSLVRKIFNIPLNSIKKYPLIFIILWLKYL